MKKFRPILGISLLVQSVTFFILCIINAEKKKGLAAIFGLFGTIGGATGAALLYTEYKERKFMLDEDEDFFDEFDEFIDDFEDIDGDDVTEDEILCTFEGNDAE